MKKQESELVVLFKIGDFSGLKEADSVEKIEQYELTSQGKGRLRVRVSTTDEGTRMVHTLKPKGTMDGMVRNNDEENIEVTASYVEIFKKLTEKRYMKTRYVFSGKESIFASDDESLELPPVKYEVDVFTRFDGQPSIWAKIDVEIQDFMQILDNHPDFKGKEIHASLKISHLPFKPQEAFLISADMTDEQRDLERRIWDEEFSQNPDGTAYKPVGSSIKKSKEEKPAPEPSEPEAK